MITKIKEFTEDGILFEDGSKLESYHQSDCCEHHWLDFSNIKNDGDYKDLEFNLSNDLFFTRIEDYGIELIPLKGFPLRIPGYGSNNGYYSSNLSLILTTKNGQKTYDISECQVISY